MTTDNSNPQDFTEPEIETLTRLAARCKNLINRYAEKDGDPTEILRPVDRDILTLLADHQKMANESRAAGRSVLDAPAVGADNEAGESAVLRRIVPGAAKDEEQSAAHARVSKFRILKELLDKMPGDDVITGGSPITEGESGILKNLILADITSESGAHAITFPPRSHVRRGRIIRASMQFVNEAAALVQQALDILESEKLIQHIRRPNSVIPPTYAILQEGIIVLERSQHPDAPGPKADKQGTVQEAARDLIRYLARQRRAERRAQKDKSQSPEEGFER